MKAQLLLTVFILTVVKFSAQLNCYQQNSGMYQYYAKLENIPNLNANFNKTDFINYASTYGNLSSGNLYTLDSEVQLVAKSFPTTQSAFLQNVVSIDSHSDIYSIISNANNSISTIECRENPILLKLKEVPSNTFKVTVTKNPIDDNSKLTVDHKVKSFKLIIYNAANQIVYENLFRNNQDVHPNTFLKTSGIYTVTIVDVSTNQIHTIKLSKLRDN